MKLLLAVVLVSIYLGYLFGGRLHRLESVRPRWWGLVIVGLGVQFVPLPTGPSGDDLIIRTVVLSISYCLLVTFAAMNIRLPGMWLILLGLACNFAVIAVNGGMPASAGALTASGQEEVLADLREGAADKHHLMTDEDELTFLADIIALPKPIGQAISVGDIFMYAGVAWLLAGAMQGRIRSASPADSPKRRGKHRQGEASEPPIQPDLGFHPPGATRSET